MSKLILMRFLVQLCTLGETEVLWQDPTMLSSIQILHAQTSILL